jgi:hypothetical protein
MSGRRSAGPLLAVLLLLSAGCSDRLTASRAATILRHSKAFLSGSPETQPILERVSTLESAPGTSSQEGDLFIVEFSYHWLPNPRADGAGLPESMTAKVFLRRFSNGWAVDDERSRTLVPSWPRLPGAPFWPELKPSP